MKHSVLVACALLAVSPSFADPLGAAPVTAEAPEPNNQTATQDPHTVALPALEEAEPQRRPPVEIIEIDPAAEAVLDRAVAFYGEVDGLEIETWGETFSTEEKSSETVGGDLPGEVAETLRFQRSGGVYFNRRASKADSDIEYAKNAADSMVLYGRQSYQSTPSTNRLMGQGLTDYGSDTGFVLTLALQGAKWREFVALMAQGMEATGVRIEGGTSTDRGHTLSRVSLSFQVPGYFMPPDEAKVSSMRGTLRRTMFFDQKGALVSVMSVDRVLDKDIKIKNTVIMKHEVNPKFASGAFELQLPPDAKPLGEM